jgi:hypothetical protein
MLRLPARIVLGYCLLHGFAAAMIFIDLALSYNLFAFPDMITTKTSIHHQNYLYGISTS